MILLWSLIYKDLYNTEKIEISRQQLEMANQRATTTRSVHSCAKRQTFPLQKNSYQLDVKIHIYHKNIYERQVVFEAYNLVFCLQPVLTTCSIKQVNFFFSPFLCIAGVLSVCCKQTFRSYGEFLKYFFSGYIYFFKLENYSVTHG